MYYVFIETGSKQFFLNLMKAFCLKYVQNIAAFYHSVKKEDGESFWDDMTAHIDKNGKGFNIFNCAQHLMTTNCSNTACRNEHTTVLAKDQQVKFGNIMQETKNRYCKDHYPGDKKKQWREIQGIFNYHKMYEFFNLEVLQFEVSDLNEYLDKYVEETNMKSLADGYAYVCAITPESDYCEFMSKTKLDKVVACNTLQTVI
jgi:hypothetical protein